GVVNVQKDRTTTRLSATTPRIAFKKPLTLTAKVTAKVPGAGIPTGTVTFKDGARVLAKVKLVKGAAKLTVSTLPRGKHTISALYSQAPAFLASTSALVSVTVS